MRVSLPTRTRSEETVEEMVVPTVCQGKDARLGTEGRLHLGGAVLQKTGR
jgi:hypothetical protein